MGIVSTFLAAALEVSSPDGNLYAYSYFWDKERGDGSKNVVASWNDGTVRRLDISEEARQ